MRKSTFLYWILFSLGFLYPLNFVMACNTPDSCTSSETTSNNPPPVNPNPPPQPPFDPVNPPPITIADMRTFSLTPSTEAKQFVAYVSQRLETKAPNKISGLFFSKKSELSALRGFASNALGGFYDTTRTATLGRDGQKVSQYLHEFDLNHFGYHVADLDLEQAKRLSGLAKKSMDEIDLQASHYMMSMAILSFAILDTENRIPLAWALSKVLKKHNEFYEKILNDMERKLKTKDSSITQSIEQYNKLLKNPDLQKLRQWISYLQKHIILEKNAPKEAPVPSETSNTSDS